MPRRKDGTTRRKAARYELQAAVRLGLRRTDTPGAQPARSIGYRSAYLAFNMAEKRAALVLRRFLALGFSKRRWRRTCSRVCSRSSFFLSRRRAFSTGSPFFSLISVINEFVRLNQTLSLSTLHESDQPREHLERPCFLLWRLPPGQWGTARFCCLRKSLRCR